MGEESDLKNANEKKISISTEIRARFMVRKDGLGPWSQKRLINITRIC